MPRRWEAARYPGRRLAQITIRLRGQPRHRCRRGRRERPRNQGRNKPPRPRERRGGKEEVMKSPSTATQRARPHAGPAWMVLSLACACQFMVILDAAIVNVALPSIRRELGFTPTGLAWVVNGYLLTFAGFMLLGGRAADLFGHRRMLAAGLFMFSASSLLCGLAPPPVRPVGAPPPRAR